MNDAESNEDPILFSVRSAGADAPERIDTRCDPNWPIAIAPSHEHGRPNAMRWRIIPGTVLAIAATLGSIGVLFQAILVTYYNMKYGWIQINPDNPTLSQLAITPLNLFVWQCGCWSTLAAGYSAYAWFYGKWRIAWIGTAVYFAIILTSKWVESL